MSKKINIMTSGIFIAISIFALIKPDSLPYIGLKFIEDFLILFDVLLAILLLINITKYKISKLTISIIIMNIFLTFSTVLHGTSNYYYLIVSIGPSIAACMYTDYCMQKSPYNYLKVSMLALNVLYTINLLTILLHPGGFYSSSTIHTGNYFMGYDNGFIYNLLPYIGYSLLFSIINKGSPLSFHSLYAMFISALTEILVWSGTGLVLIAIMLIFVFCSNVPIVKKFIEPRLLIGLFFAGTFLIVFLRVGDLFSPLIVSVLKKDVTFTGRAYLWDSAINSIKENWLIGIGEGGFTLSGFSSIGVEIFYQHPHCLILNMLYKGGVFMLAAFIFIIVHFTEYVRKWIQYPAAKVILMVVASTLFGEIVNSGAYKPFFWAFIVMATYIPQLSGVDYDKRELVRIKIK